MNAYYENLDLNLLDGEKGFLTYQKAKHLIDTIAETIGEEVYYDLLYIANELSNKNEAGDFGEVLSDKKMNTLFADLKNQYLEGEIDLGALFGEKLDQAVKKLDQVKAPPLEEIEKIKVLVVRANEQPVLEEIPNTLRGLQEKVGGNIEAVHLDETSFIYCDEEGKLKGLPINRNVNGSPINGTFIVLGNDFGVECSLTKEQIQKYSEQFKTELLDEEEEIQLEDGTLPKEEVNLNFKEKINL